MHLHAKYQHVLSNSANVLVSIQCCENISQKILYVIWYLRTWMSVCVNTHTCQSRCHHVKTRKTTQRRNDIPVQMWGYILVHLGSWHAAVHFSGSFVSADIFASNQPVRVSIIRSSIFISSQKTLFGWHRIDNLIHLRWVCGLQIRKGDPDEAFKWFQRMQSAKLLDIAGHWVESKLLLLSWHSWWESSDQKALRNQLTDNQVPMQTHYLSYFEPQPFQYSKLASTLRPTKTVLISFSLSHSMLHPRGIWKSLSKLEIFIKVIDLQTDPVKSE